MREISLTQGKVALVDDEDYELVSKYKWYAHWDKHTRSFYADTTIQLPSRKRIRLSMHRLILGLEFGNKKQTDHINHDTLDNRRSNLRIVTTAQNQHNGRLLSNNNSGFRGVSLNKQTRKWIAQIKVSGKQIYLGSFKEKYKAAKAYDEAARKYHGKYACTNESMGLL